MDKDLSSRTIKVVAVSPVFNRREATLQCLRSMRRLRLDGIHLSIIIVDDASSDGTAEAIGRDFPEVEVIEGGGDLWYAEGTNVGIRRALERGADFVWQFNDDEVFDSEALVNLVRTASKYAPAVVGSALLLWDTPHRVFQVAPVWNTFGGGWTHWFSQTVWTLPAGPFEVEQIVGNSVLVPAEAYRRHGLLDSKRFPMVGDGDLTCRLKRRGYRLIVEPRSRVFCMPNTPPASVSRMNLMEKLKALFGDARRPHNLRRRLTFLMVTGPSPLHGVVAFVALMARAVLGLSYEGPWGTSRREPELRELFPPLEH